ncbi:MAG: mobile mystery protein B [Desulfovibrionales bacterium]|nr:mobile mystery protein B [Desulfovibrionales bacterium]
MNHFEYPEGATPLDPDEMEGLKLSHITTRGELDRWEQENINDAMDWLERRRKGDILTETFVLKLHSQMFGKVWGWAGKYRQSGKNIGVDWTTISVELRKLLGDVQYWIENGTYDSDEIAARFHHRLVAIHLFANGNGRHARLMADTLLTEVLKQEPFSWGKDNLSKDGDVRKRYIKALKKADNHEYQPLFDFVRS